jgi:hypothetical protein
LPGDQQDEAGRREAGARQGGGGHAAPAVADDAKVGPGQGGDLGERCEVGGVLGEAMVAGPVAGAAVPCLVDGDDAGPEACRESRSESPPDP